MEPAGLSLLTYPTLPCREYPREWLKLIAKLGLALVRFDAKGFGQLLKGGHPGVTRSILTGCTALGMHHNLNVHCPSALYPWVLVLSSVPALKQAIRLREKGQIEKLWAGPNLVVLPTDESAILAHPMIDRVVVPSRWVARQYVSLLPALDGRIVVWPAGVDLQKDWSTTTQPRHQSINHHLHVLHYNKLSLNQWHSVWHPVYRRTSEWLTENNCVQSEVRYGSHTQAQYRRLLRQADLMLYWSDAGESQGLALLEAWAMDIPTFVAGNTRVLIRGVSTEVSTAPYLSADCGSFFHSLEELQELLLPLISHDQFYGGQPRRWVQRNMTDRLSTKHLVNLFVNTEMQS